MDQDSTNGASNDKPNWRERLGIGTKDMPKISDEFKSQPFATPTEKPEARTPQPVTKLAPMAPRAHGHPSATSTVNQEKQAGPNGPAAGGLAEKLRAQRDAAEKLAVQRVSAARQRAEARIAAEPRPGGQSRDLPASRPKFSFADDHGAPATDTGGNGVQRNAAGGSLLPPRPALGGDRSQSSLFRQSSPSYRLDLPPAFRPIDPATGYPGLSSRTAAFGGQRADPHGAGGLAAINRNLASKASYDPYRRDQDSPYAADGRGEDPRFGRSLAHRTRGTAPEDDADDVFEDEAPQARRRAGVSDYHSAYREAEENDGEGRHRSNGPWLLLLALLAAAFAMGGVYFLWSRAPVSTATNTTPETVVPVIKAPEEPAKTAAEKVPTAGDVAGIGRKQIYDRIVGDQEVTGGTVVPTEVTPIQPERDSGDNAIPLPTGSNEQDTDEVVPLALPPAPGQDIEGKIDQGTIQKVMAASERSGVEEVKTQTTTSQSSDNIASLLPATGTEETAADTAQTKASTSEASSSTTTGSDTVASTQTETQSQPPVQKAAAKKKKPAAETTASLGEPLVIVPPGEIIAPSQESTDTGTLSTADTAPKQPAPRKKRTLFDLFNGNKSDAAPAEETPVVKQETPQKTDETQVASLPSEIAKPVPEKQPVSVASGYFVQLASFRSQDEAQTEYARLRSKYPSVIGPLPSSISQTTVAGSTRHTLGLGPLTTREQGAQICSTLLAGGERDCRVRKQ